MRIWALAVSLLVKLTPVSWTALAGLVAWQSVMGNDRVPSGPLLITGLIAMAGLLFGGGRQLFSSGDPARELLDRLLAERDAKLAADGTPQLRAVPSGDLSGNPAARQSVS